MTDTGAVAAQIAKTFIARRDVKAVQSKSGAYMPVTDTGKPDGNRLPWTMGDLKAHVEGTKTFGHYVVSKENTAKVFCFDLDLEKEIKPDNDIPRGPRWHILPPGAPDIMERFGDAREKWRPLDLWQWCFDCGKGWFTDYQPARCEDPDHKHDVRVGAHPDTLALTTLLQDTAFRLASRVRELLEIPVAVSYSGFKGLHVYGLVGEAPAADVRAAANLILESFEGRYANSRGHNFFKDRDADYEAIQIEVFPKQEALDGKDLGNLIRLPLGVNRKSGNRGFFLKHGPFGFLTEMDAMSAMTEGNPWQ